MKKKFGQKDCQAGGSYRFTCPGRDEGFVYEDHVKVIQTMPKMPRS